MADNNEQKIFEDRARFHTSRRDELTIQGFKALLLLNGGGAIALLAFLQSLWTEPEARALLDWIVLSIVLCLLGAVASSAAFFMRYRTSLAYQFKNRDGPLAGKHETCS